AGDHAVEVGGVTLCHQHRLPPTGRAAGEIGVVRRLAVVPRDDLFCENGHATDSLIRKVETRLLVPHESRVERPFALLPSIRAHDGEPARERRLVAGRGGADRRLHRSVQSAASLKQESAIPVAREREGKTDPVALAVRAGPAIEHAVDTTIGWKRPRYRH